ncbi:hypothetical protein [Aestuariispira insulae]|nr:hypothetical protein [Aestuariispira insulae]
MREADADSIELADQETVRAVSDEFVNAETGASTAIGGKGSLAIPLEFQSGGLLLSGPPLFWNAEGSSFAGWER